jgi:NAD(P)-dependent dehydrogenase (short-subunit alcohol dehydrogenase family)
MSAPSAQQPVPSQQQYPGRTAEMTPRPRDEMRDYEVSRFGAQVPMGRAAHPDEIAPSYVFFAAGRLSSY